VVVRTTASSTIPTTVATRTDPVGSHIPIITNSSKLIKSKQSKDDVTKRASVRRTLGRSKLSRSPVKPLTTVVSGSITSTTTVTTTTAISQNPPERAQVEESFIGPVTRSRMCRFCTVNDDNANETNYKRGKRSLSNSRFHDKKNKLSRKNQILAPSSITTTSLTRKLRKEASLDSALADVALNVETNDNSSLSEAPAVTKTRVKKATVRSASSQKVSSSN
jgi:hypothetical protein